VLLHAVAMLCVKHTLIAHVITLSLFAAMILQVVKLQDLSVKQKQRMYLRFTKELFILHQLLHPRIVPVYACASTLDEVTLVMKVYCQLLHCKSSRCNLDILTCYTYTVYANHTITIASHSTCSVVACDQY
jgi:hypothetical protein